MTDTTNQPPPPVSPLASALDAPSGGAGQADDGCVTVTVEVNGVSGFAKVRRDEVQHVCGLWGFRPDRRDRCPRCEANEAAAEDARSRIADREKLQPPPPAPAEFLILSPYRVDDVWLFWRHGGSGYTADLNEAGRFSKAKAHDHTRSTHGEHVAVPAADVLAVSVPVVMFNAGRALRDKLGKDGAK